MAAIYHNADTIRDLMAEVRLCHKQIATLKDQLRITQGERDHWKREAREWHYAHDEQVYATDDVSADARPF